MMVLFPWTGRRTFSVSWAFLLPGRWVHPGGSLEKRRKCDGDEYLAGFRCGLAVLEDMQEGWKKYRQ